MADRVTVIGWDGSPLTEAARSALGAATLVAGAAHHLALPEVPHEAERIRLGSVHLAARRIALHRGSAVVLADGDPGFFGVVRALRAGEHGLEVEVVPAVSAVASAFARAGMPWEDAEIVVAHPRTLRRAVNVCRAHPKVAVLTSPGAGPAELGLLLEGVHRTFRDLRGTRHRARTHHRRHLRPRRRPRLARPQRRHRHRRQRDGGRHRQRLDRGTRPRGPRTRLGAPRTRVRGGDAPGGRVPRTARGPTGPPRPPYRRPRVGHRLGDRRLRRRGRALRGRRARRRRGPGRLRPHDRLGPPLRRAGAGRARRRPAHTRRPPRARCRTGRGRRRTRRLGRRGPPPGRDRHPRGHPRRGRTTRPHSGGARLRRRVRAAPVRRPRCGGVDRDRTYRRVSPFRPPSRSRPVNQWPQPAG
ncbi:precorrin-6Y C5,15-methyltransferase [Streptomyces sp. SPB78]|nr:precorrin-6Y C5,15-methyltransferase [Streptomyces sp. SPB78]